MSIYIRRLSQAVLLIYTVFLVYLMLFGFGRSYVHAQYMYNIIPFRTIKQFLQIDSYNLDTWLINLVGNIGVFVLFGIIMPIALHYKFIRSYALFISGIWILELLQLVTKRGSFDVDDLILNSIGFIVGYILYMLYLKFSRYP